MPGSGNLGPKKNVLDDKEFNELGTGITDTKAGGKAVVRLQLKQPQCLD